MNDINDNIPTLTDLIFVGDEDMLNHFSAQQFTTQQKDKTEHDDVITENSFDNGLSDHSEAYNISTDDLQDDVLVKDLTEDEIETIPSITMPEDQLLDLSDEDFSESMQHSYPPTEAEVTNKIDEDIKSHIDSAVEAILPEIEAQLKNSLYTRFKG